MLSFGEVESYAKKESGCENTSKAYKFFAEPGYLHNVKGNEFYQNVIKILLNWRT